MSPLGEHDGVGVLRVLPLQAAALGGLTRLGGGDGILGGGKEAEGGGSGEGKWRLYFQTESTCLISAFH